ncbi:MAG: hypothetical protein A6F72_03645 [Cycloclasticus sp. symbiont of Poecilosclerida sp. N]|nr:MAG: hypothetical protein A6F72_01650 [Cycloclasticus sp. symbiont of Poecilosclerida sp. N]ORU91834.1 MAG: hypothetical protein A6F72_03645 [Cycloclasticus sp. symbiont of Poecilosclerida sp. N]
MDKQPLTSSTPSGALNKSSAGIKLALLTFLVKDTVKRALELEINLELRQIVIEELQLKCSPEQI